MTKKRFAIHHAKRVAVVDGRIVGVTDPRKVRVMAIAEGYAMVRRRGAMPYVASVKELEFNDDLP